MCNNVVEKLGDPCDQAVVTPYVELAADRLAGTRFEEMLSPACREAQLAVLSRTLHAYAEDAIARLVATKLAERNPFWALDARLAPTAETERARAGVAADILASGGAVLNTVAPLLAAELARQTGRFVSVTLETCERIWQDSDEIASVLLGGSGGVGRVTEMGADLGDCHDGGRRTTVVTCEAGRFVYKPHDCRIDEWFRQVAENRLPGALAQPRTILRSNGTGSWGFQEFMARACVEDEEGLARYWRNMGRAFALFQALGSEDLHSENFVAVGEHPSLIDCETVITSEPAMRGDALESPNFAYASKGFGNDLDQTPVKSGLLPSALWPKAEGNARSRQPAGDTSPLLARRLSCLPVLAGEERDILGYERELLAGLDEGLEALATVADGLAEDVRAASDVPVRRLIRDTGVYGLLLARLRRADAYDPQVRAALLDKLHRPLIRGQGATRSPLAESEAACLTEGDVPYFYAAAGSRKIVGSDGTTDDRLLEASATERALAHIDGLDASHRSFVHAVVEANMRRAIVPDSEETPACEFADRPLAASEALAEADRVFGMLERMAVVSPSGERSWIFRSTTKGVLGRSTIDFSRGLGGVAAFLAALASRTADPSARERALELLDGCLSRFEEVIAVMETARVVPEDSVGLGLADGLGGVVRSIDLVVRALEGVEEDGSAASRAKDLLWRTLAALGKADVERARHVDVYGGAAGLLLALSQCPMARGSEKALDIASRLARRLDETRTLSAKGGAVLWDTLGTGWPVSGFGHGQAGVAAALAAAQGAFGLGHGDAAREALAWELAAYDERLGTWPDLRRSPVSSAYMHGVCSGAPGVGLAALTARGATDDEAVRSLADALVERADRACLTLPPNHRDTLCCGNGAIAEYLASRGLDVEAGRLLAGMVARARGVGSYVLYHQGVRLTDEPDLLNGLSGVGYELLRHADPALPGVFVDPCGSGSFG